MGATAEEVRKHVKTYWMIFIALAFCTVVTVGIAYYHLPPVLAVIVAMLVASIKASLVALFFMHLNSERKIIYGTLGLTAFMFLVLMMIPLFLATHGK
jgi:cytochrome c oxidase subunit IV